LRFQIQLVPLHPAAVKLDPAGNGQSLSVLGDPRNKRVNLTGAVPADARVIGVKYDLNLEALFPSFASEACLAFKTTAGYEAVTCPSELTAAGKVQVTGDSMSFASAASGAASEAAAAAAGLSPTGGSLNDINRGKTVSFNVGEDGVLAVELFESYDDFAAGGIVGGGGGGGGGGDDGDNLTSDPADATWVGLALFMLFCSQSSQNTS
jgi:hypothetical protein